MPDSKHNIGWVQVTLKDRTLCEEYLQGLKTVREHYQTRTLEDVYHFVRDKIDCEAWIYYGDGFKLGITMLFKNGTGRYRIANAWCSGDIAIETGLDIWTAKADEYCARHGVKEYDVRLPKDMLGNMGFVTRAKIVASVAQKYDRIVRERNTANEEVVVMHKS